MITITILMMMMMIVKVSRTTQFLETGKLPHCLRDFLTKYSLRILHTLEIG